jgi:hypothetical protein
MLLGPKQATYRQVFFVFLVIFIEKSIEISIRFDMFQYNTGRIGQKQPVLAVINRILVAHNEIFIGDFHSQ